MKCAVHLEAEATGFCRNCGKALCAQCVRDVRGVLYCEECLAKLVSQPQQPVPGGPSPALAALLGWVPGLGAVYNGEYTKALIHVAVFAGLIALISSDQPTPHNVFFSLALAGFVFYMPIEAYRTAKEKQFARQPAAAPISTAAGAPAPSGSAGFAPEATAPAETAPPAAPARTRSNWLFGPLILIILGVLFLLGNFGLLSLDWLDRFWPIILIAIGVGIIWRRTQRPT